MRVSGALRWLACGLCSACTGGGGPIAGAANDEHDRVIAVPEHGGGGDAGAGVDVDAEAAAYSRSPAASGARGSDPEPDPDLLTGLEKVDPYPAPVFPDENPNSPEKALLGKILFWEEQLSSHDTHACGTCHQPASGGSDPRAALAASLGAGPNGTFGDEDDARGSAGVVRCDSAGTRKPDPVYALQVQVTARKTPSAMDAWFFEQLFWDGRAASAFVDPVTGAVAIASGGALESQAAGPPLSSVEMSCEGYDWITIESKLAATTPLKWASQLPAPMVQALMEHPSYPSLFEWAYGTPEVTARRILFAIATYERQLRSDKTPWDRFNAGDSEALTPDQQAGLALFNVKARCSACHVPPLFTDNQFHNIGAQAPELDPGRSSISGDPADLGKMKTPTLRNVGLRAAGGLLHLGAGSGATLRSVLGVYRQGGIHHENISPEIHALNLPDFEFEQLLEFVEHGLTDPRASTELPPFDRPRLRSEQ